MLPAVLVEAIPLVAVAVVATVMAGAMAKLGGENAPEVAAGAVEVGVVLVAEVDDADCASAGLLSPSRTAAANVRLPSLDAIAGLP